MNIPEPRHSDERESEASVRRVATEDGGSPQSGEARVGLTQPASHLRTEARPGHSPRLGPDTAVTPRPDDTHPMSGPTPGADQ